MENKVILGHFYRVEKIDQLPDRPVGFGSGGPIEKGYVVEGFGLESPIEGKRFAIVRTKRNDTFSLGLFETSILAKVLKTSDGWSVQTQNSVYKITILQEVAEDML